MLARLSRPRLESRLRVQHSTKTPSITSPTPTADTTMIGIFSLINALFTLSRAEEEVEVEGEGALAASRAAWFGAEVGGALLVVWSSRTLIKSACADAGSVVDSSCTYGSAVVFTLPSTKSPKLMSRYAFRTVSKNKCEGKYWGGWVGGAHGMMSPKPSRNLQTHWESWAGTGARCQTTYIAWMP